MKTVSVIVPVYNTSKTLRKCIDSILCQTYKALDIIIVDDGSKDASPDICDHYANIDPRVRVFHIPNGGVSNARNVGVENTVGGEYLTFVDSDDYIDYDYIEQLMKHEADMIVSGYRTFGESVTLYEPKRKTLKNGGSVEYDLEAMCKYLYLRAPWSKLYRTDLIKNNKLSFNCDLKIGEDSCFVFEYMSYCESIKLIPYTGYNYYIESQYADKKYGLNTESYKRHLLETLSCIGLTETHWHVKLSVLRDWYKWFYYGMWYGALRNQSPVNMLRSVKEFKEHRLYEYRPLHPFRRVALLRVIYYTPWLACVLFVLRKIILKLRN